MTSIEKLEVIFVIIKLKKKSIRRFVMIKTVVEFQSSFQSILNTLKKNKDVLAIFTFGSILTGDVWEESDIDLFVIYNNEFSKVRDVYSEVLGIPVHTKFLNKDKFMELYKSNGQGGFARNLLISSKLVFHKDDEIQELYNGVRYSMDNHAEKRNLVYLSRLLKELGVCKKYLQNGGIYTSYEVLIRALGSLSKLYINLKGYTVSKDSLVMATNLSRSFKSVVDDLFLTGANKESIQATIDFIDKFLDMYIERASKSLLDHIYTRGANTSSYDIKMEDEFKEYNIKVENILKELYNRGLISKDSREFLGKDGFKILEEKVYAPILE